jgi:peptidoglycan/LPS O-acetylase OafA/YrhL
MSVDVRPVSAPVTTERPTHRRADIQGLRAVAVLLVVAFHAHLPVPGGFVGVDVFFVISGFVITAMLMREWVATGALSFRRFYFRRFLRLTPALALTVAVVALVSLLLQNPFGAQQTTARTGLGAMLLSANFVIGHNAGDYFSADTTTNPLLNTWSLSVEEQFYLIFPALLAFGWLLGIPKGRHAKPLSRRPAVILVSLIAIGSFALSMVWTYGSPFLSGLTSYFGGPESFAFYSPFTRAWEFAVGALLALRIARLRPTSTASSVGLGVIGAALIVVSAFTIQESAPFPGAIAVVPVLGTALVLLAGSSETVGVNRALAARPMVAIGDASYSWYLWHWPVIVFAAVLFPRNPTILIVAAVVSIAPALLSYRFVEQPIRRLRPRSKPRALAIVVPTVGIPLALCIALLAGANSSWGLLPDESTIPVAAPLVAAPVPVASTRGTGITPEQGSAASAPSAPLTTPDAAAHGTGAVPPPAATAGGDVLSTQSTPANPTEADQAETQATAKMDGQVAEGDGGNLRSQHVAVKNGCVNTDLNPTGCRFGSGGPNGTILLAGDSQAYAVADGTIAAADSLGYDTIVTSHTGCPFLGRESSGTHDYPCRSWQKSIVAYALENKPSAVLISNRSSGYLHPEWKWRTAATDSGGVAGSAKEAAAMWRKGLEPVLSQLSEAGIPVLFVGAVPEMTGYTNGTSLLANAFGTRDFDVPRTESEAVRKQALEVETALTKKYPGVSYFDSFPSLCDESSCWAVYDGQIRYQDEDHLSVDGSMLLTNGLTTAIRDAVAGTPTVSPSAASGT